MIYRISVDEVLTVKEAGESLRTPGLVTDDDLVRVREQLREVVAAVLSRSKVKA